MNLFDFFLARSNLGKASPTYTDGDVDYDGDVDNTDLDWITSNIGKTVAAPPASADDVAVSVNGTDSLTVTRGALPSGAAEPEKWKVYRSPDGVDYTEIGEINGSDQSYTDTGLADGTKYWYRMRPWNAATGAGHTTAESWGVTNLPTPSPASSQRLNAYEIELTWNATSANADEVGIWVSEVGGTPELHQVVPSSDGSFIFNSPDYSGEVELYFAYNNSASGAQSPLVSALGGQTTQQEALDGLSDEILDDAQGDTIALGQPRTYSASTPEHREATVELGFNITGDIGPNNMSDYEVAIRVGSEAWLLPLASVLGHTTFTVPPFVHSGRQLDFDVEYSGPTNGVGTGSNAPVLHVTHLSTGTWTPVLTLSADNNTSLVEGETEGIVRVGRGGDNRLTQIDAKVDDLAISADPEDYTYVPNGYTIAAGVISSAQKPVNAVDDGEFESHETFELSVRDPSTNNGYVVSKASGSVTYGVDDEPNTFKSKKYELGLNVVTANALIEALDIDETGLSEEVRDELLSHLAGMAAAINGPGITLVDRIRQEGADGDEWFDDPFRHPTLTNYVTNGDLAVFGGGFSPKVGDAYWTTEDDYTEKEVILTADVTLNATIKGFGFAASGDILLGAFPLKSNGGVDIGN